jgi:hypothetical protein
MILSPASAHAAVQGYYRFPTVNGDNVVFMSEGDLWKAPISGGVAMRLTSHPGTEIAPHFSPDGKNIAFSADYQGNTDIYVTRWNGATWSHSEDGVAYGLDGIWGAASSDIWVVGSSIYHYQY